MFLSLAEISNFKLKFLAVPFHQDIVEFYVSVHNLAPLLHETKTVQDLCYNASTFTFTKSAARVTCLLHVLFEIEVTKLHKKVSFFPALNYLIQFHYVSMF